MSLYNVNASYSRSGWINKCHVFCWAMTCLSVWCAFRTSGQTTNVWWLRGVRCHADCSGFWSGFDQWKCQENRRLVFFPSLRPFCNGIGTQIYRTLQNDDWMLCLLCLLCRRSGTGWNWPQLCHCCSGTSQRQTMTSSAQGAVGQLPYWDRLGLGVVALVLFTSSSISPGLTFMFEKLKGCCLLKLHFVHELPRRWNSL